MLFKYDTVVIVIYISSRNGDAYSKLKKLFRWYSFNERQRAHDLTIDRSHANDIHFA